MNNSTVFCILFFLLLATKTYSQENIAYQQPDPVIMELATADFPGLPYLLTLKNKIILRDKNSYKTIKELAEPELRLGGLRINPELNISSREEYYSNFSLQNIDDSSVIHFKELPENARIANFLASSDHNYVAFTLTEEDGVSLWVLDVENAKIKKLTKPALNCNLGRPFTWVAQTGQLIVRMLPADKPKLIDKEKAVPAGPKITVNDGKKAQNRTYQDLLKDRVDEENFQNLITSELAIVNVDGSIKKWMGKDMYSSISVSPNGEFVKIRAIRKPFSYLVTYGRFPSVSSIYTIQGERVSEIRNKPLMEVLPKGSGSVMSCRREISWRKDKPASIYYVEALDGGDPKNKVEYRDALYELEYPFKGNGRLLMKTKNRFSSAIWGNEKVAVVKDRWSATRNTKTYLLNPLTGESKIIFDRNYQDVYNSPGKFVTEKNEMGQSCLVVDKSELYLMDEGQTAEGKKPFISKYNLKNGKTKKIFEIENKDKLEKLIRSIDIKKGEILSSIQSQQEYPNYYFRNIKTNTIKQITFSESPYKSMDGITKQVVRYKRDDGLPLSATMYLPEGYDANSGEKLPMILWAYPREYKDRGSAGQVRNDENSFIRLGYGSMVFWAKKGYMVMDKASFPIIGEGDEEPNDTFIKQLVANAKAAIDFADSLGYVDRKRVAVGGHSYGAFMTANLLTHSDLFAAGIARSGAYNRTLTPFGFQNEDRSYWDAPDVYNTMSPFMNAPKMKHPLLLIHGEADNNSGTYPMQSERYFNALKGLGATVRLVMLPLESHGYKAKESILHLLWEEDQWLEKYLKN